MGARPIACRVRVHLLLALVFAFAAGPRSRSLAQEATCGSTSAGPLRVEDPVGAQALRAAVNCTDGGTVEAEWAGAVVLDAPISVGSGTFLYITGDDELAEVHGDSQTRMFEVSPSGLLSLTQLKLSGGNAESGGAIYSSMATVELESCVFGQNAATAGDGGAVWVQGGDLTIKSGEFSDNSASRYGGAVFAVDAGVVIQDSTVFESNKAVEGGGLYCGGFDNSTTPSATGSCSLSEVTFTANNASSEDILDYDSIVSPWVGLYGGGGAAFYRGDVDITDSAFTNNYAQLSGGGLYGGTESSMSIEGCVFEENYSQGHGGAMAASTATLGGTTAVVLTNNSVDANGAAIFGWDETGAIELNNVICSENMAVGNGGCFYVSGGGSVNDGVEMINNEGKFGGCIYAFGGCDLDVNGGNFSSCVGTSNGAFMFASDGAIVNIKEATVTNCVAIRRGAVVYCSGDSFELGGSKVTIEGGTFSDNRALELGGAISAWGTPTVVNITGGLFSNNTAKFYGGFIFLEEEASLVCEGATIVDHYAGDQGGAIYGRDATWVNSSCDLIGNGAPQGAAAYLTHTVGAAYLTNHDVTDNFASGGSVVYAAETSIVARGVNFNSAVELQNDYTTRAVQLENMATLSAEGCIFSGWTGDTVVHNANTAGESLVLDSCDFRESTAVTMVASPYSDAAIRNAFVGLHTIDNAVMLGDSPVLVDRALGCGDLNACGSGECVDSVLGVLCECLEDAVCLTDGGSLSISLKTPPSEVTYSPDPVYFELLISAAQDGSTLAIWNLTSEADDLALTPFPCSGVLLPGGNTTVAVTGTPLRQDVGGSLLSRFVLRRVGGDGADVTEGVELEVESAFYLCQAFEYAMPTADGGVTCEQCATVSGEEGLDCEEPGATLASMPVREGYWRSGQESLEIRSCILSEACAGATQIQSSDDYCADGYEGPYCAACQGGYGKGVGSTCHSCENAESRWLIFAGALFLLMALFFLLLAIVFLVGGLDAVEQVRLSITRKMSVSANMAPAFWKSARGTTSLASGARVSAAQATASWRAEGNEGTEAGVAAFAPAFAPSSDEIGHREGEGQRQERYLSRSDKHMMSRRDFSDQGSFKEGETRSANTVVGDVTAGFAGACVSGTGTASYADRGATLAPATGGGNALALASCTESELDQLGEGGRREKSGSACCGLGEKIKRWASLIPLDKLKILVVVWQILTVFPSITGADFPPAYSRFLSWIDIVNLDLGSIFSGTCILPQVSFYHRLLLTTLAPLGLVVLLASTYQLAKRRAGIGSASMVAKRAAWSRHIAAGLLLTFLVFTSTSTVVFETFACDNEVVEGESYLRADYKLSCDSAEHIWYMVYAGFMIAVYPVGIPLLYAFILYINRESLNPRVQVAEAVDPDSDSSRKAKPEHAPKETAEELEERLKKRMENPDLVPSMFLWKDFGPDLYYYEVIECGRRILLTGALIFIAPHTAAQAAVACIFAFASLLGFELLRPHLDPADSWLYRLGCVVIFLSNFLALLIKAGAAGEGNRAVLGGILIAVNVLLILAVLSASWFATQKMVDDNRTGESGFAVARTMLTHEQLVATSKREERAESVKVQNEHQKSAGIGDGGGGGGGSVSSSSSLNFGMPRLSGSVGPRLGRRGGGVSAAMVEELWREDKAMGSSAR
ncbi:unnamed protein product [Scytosiphon promiscuus]